MVERDRGGGSSQAIDAKGTWWVKKGKLCFRYPDSLRDTGKKCRLIVPLGEGAYELRSVKGKTTHTWDRIGVDQRLPQRGTRGLVADQPQREGGHLPHGGLRAGGEFRAGRHRGRGGSARISPAGAESSRFGLR